MHWVTTQFEPIWKQLQLSVRHVDLRVGYDWTMRHGHVRLFEKLNVFF